MLADIREVVARLPDGSVLVSDWDRELQSALSYARLPALRADIARLVQQLETFRALLRVAWDAPHDRSRSVEYFDRWIRRTLVELEEATAARDEAELAMFEADERGLVAREERSVRSLGQWARALVDLVEEW